MRRFGPEPPWTGGGRYGSWRRGEDFWDGTPVWEYVDYQPFSFLDLLAKLNPPPSLQEKVVWLEDQLPETSAVMAATAFGPPR